MKAKFVNEAIKHLAPHSEEELEDRGYTEEMLKWASWQSDGYMTLNNWGGIEIKIIDNGDGVEYRFNYGDEGNEVKPVHDAEIEWVEDPDNDEKDEEGFPISEPSFMVGDSRYFLKDFMRS